jgi:hypothetical protein
VPSLADLAALHRHGFVADDDLVRQETSERWVTARQLLGSGARRRRGDHRWIWSVLLAAVALVAALALALAARSGAGRRPTPPPAQRP